MYRLAQKEILGLAERRKVKIQYVERTVLDSISPNKYHQVRYRSSSNDGMMGLQCLA